MREMLPKLSINRRNILTSTTKMPIVSFQIMEITLPLSFISFIAFLLVLRLIYKLNSMKHSKTPKLPPGPWKLPIIGSLHHLALLGSLPHRALRDLARKHGQITHLQLGEISAVVVSGARMAKEVLKFHDIALADRPKLLAAEIITYNYQDIGFSPFGVYWRQMRKICNSELLGVKNVRAFCSIREDEVWNMIGSIQLLSSAMSPVNLTEKVFAYTNAITCRAAFGARCKYQDELIPLIKETIEASGGFEIADLFPSKKFLHIISGTIFKLTRLHSKLDRILDNIIQEHIENPATTDYTDVQSREEDLVDVLLKIKERGGLDFPISKNSIKAIIVDMFSAGTETSATTIIWAMSEMIRKPGIIEIAQAEVRRFLKGKRRIHEEDLKPLCYSKLVIKETLRLHPPLPLLLPRECREKCEIDGFDIPLKTKVIVNAWAVNRDPEFWKDAETFEPERFLNNGIEFLGTNFEYIPFGGGRRMCPGISFGVAAVELALAQLLYHFDWKLPDGANPELLDMTEIFGSSVGRKNSLCLVATPHFSFE